MLRKLNHTCRPVYFVAAGPLLNQLLCLPPSCSKKQCFAPQYMAPFSFDVLAAFMFAISKKRTESQKAIYFLCYKFAIGPKPVAKSGTATNATYWIGLSCLVLERE